LLPVLLSRGSLADPSFFEAHVVSTAADSAVPIFVWILLALLVALAALAAMLVRQRSPPGAAVVEVATLALTLYSLLVDWLFIAELAARAETPLVACMLLFTLLPMALTACGIVLCIRRRQQLSLDLAEWWRVNKPPASVVLLLGAIGLDLRLPVSVQLTYFLAPPVCFGRCAQP
jgi:hypothetical protein